MLIPKEQAIHQSPGPVVAHQAEPPATTGQRFVRPAAQDSVCKLINPDKDGLAVAHVARHVLQPPASQQLLHGIHAGGGFNQRLARAAFRHLFSLVGQGRRV